MQKRVYKNFDIDITAAGTVYSKTFDLDKTVVAIHGLLFLSDRDDLLYYRGSGKVEINREEIFPETYASKLLMSGINVSPNDRYWKLNALPPGNGKIKVDYRDSNHVLAAFAPYRVSLYIDCEIADMP